MKILELNGHKYSRESFDGYKYSSAALFERDGEEHRLFIYTTDTEKSSVFKVLSDLAKEGVTLKSLPSWNSKEQDDKISELLNEAIGKK